MQETLVWFLGQEDPCRRDRLPTPVFLGFPGGAAGKESAHNVGDLGSIPGMGRSPGKGKGYLIQYSGLENSMDYIVHGVTKSGHNWATFIFTFFMADQSSQTFHTTLNLLAPFSLECLCLTLLHQSDSVCPFRPTFNLSTLPWAPGGWSIWVTVRVLRSSGFQLSLAGNEEKGSDVKYLFPWLFPKTSNESWLKPFTEDSYLPRRPRLYSSQFW